MQHGSMRKHLSVRAVMMAAVIVQAAACASSSNSHHRDADCDAVADLQAVMLKLHI